MKKALTIFRHEFIHTVKRKSFILITIAVPLLLILAFVIYNGIQRWSKPSEPDEITIGYVDKTGMFDDYHSQGIITFDEYNAEAGARSALLAGTVDSYIVIPSDYLSSGNINRYTMDREVELPLSTIKSVKDFLLDNLLAQSVSEEILDRAKAPFIPNSIRLDATGEISTGQDPVMAFVLPYIFAFLFMFSIFFTSGYLLQSVSEEKENRVIEILLSSVSSGQLLVGKIFGLGAAGLLQIAIWLGSIIAAVNFASVSIPLFSEASIPIDTLFLGILYFVLGYLFLATIFAAIGSIVRTAREGQSWSGLITTPAAVLPMALMYLIITNPTHIVSRILTLFPLTAPITSMIRISGGTLPAWETAVSLLILACSVALLMWLAAKIFRTYLLMYGKRPSIKEIIRSIRAA
ncbi:ABC transporter permease [Chloroflexota bacterium]